MLHNNRNEVVDPARGGLVIRDDQLKWSVLSEWLVVAGVGHQHLALMEIGVDLGERETTAYPSEPVAIT